MLHPTCGSDLRRSTKVTAMIDSILSGLSIFCGVAVLNNMFEGIKDPNVSAFPVGCMIVFIILMGIEMYLAFRLYRAAHERDVQRLRAWKKGSSAVILFCTVIVLLFHHTVGPLPTPYPLLWFYVVYFITGIFRMYMVWVVSVFLTDFELS